MRPVGAHDTQYAPLGHGPYQGIYYVRDGEWHHARNVRVSRRLRRALERGHRGAWTGFLRGLFGGAR